jgi:hypothetical protein
MGFMVKVEDDWKANVKVYTDDAAIRWKASQPKDCEKIRSENSEDGLTWQVFRTFAATGHLDDWVKDALGIVDNFVPYYWQRLHDSGKIDADIAAALREIEPYHEKNRRQHTETDLILRGKRHLVVCEMKLGYKIHPITGWQQARKSPIVDDYQPYATLFVVDKANWRESMGRFAQLYKNLILGNVLRKSWYIAPVEDPGAAGRDSGKPDGTIQFDTAPARSRKRCHQVPGAEWYFSYVQIGICRIL